MLWHRLVTYNIDIVTNQYRHSLNWATYDITLFVLYRLPWTAYVRKTFQAHHHIQPMTEAAESSSCHFCCLYTAGDLCISSGRTHFLSRQAFFPSIDGGDSWSLSSLLLASNCFEEDLCSLNHNLRLVFLASSSLLVEDVEYSVVSWWKTEAWWVIGLVCTFTCEVTPWDVCFSSSATRLARLALSSFCWGSLNRTRREPFGSLCKYGSIAAMVEGMFGEEARNMSWPK